jgi:hypothetical protein
MKFFFDESGRFQLPRAGEHAVGIVSGIAIPDADEAEVFRQFDAFLSTLPPASLKNGEPKGRGCKPRFVFLTSYAASPVFLAL